MEEPLLIYTRKYNGIVDKITDDIILANTITNIAMPTLALWDTGATTSCISKYVAKNLELTPLGMQEIHTPSGKGIVNRYKIHVILNGELQVVDVDVFDSEIGSQGIGIIIGMNIISMGDIAISNFGGNTIFNFRIPSQKNIVFEK